MPQLNATSVLAYVEFDGGTRRSVTSERSYVEQLTHPNQVKTTQTIAYVELIPEDRFRATEVTGYLEVTPIPEYRISEVTAYIEFVPDAIHTLTPLGYTPDTSAKIAQLIGLVGVQSNKARLSQLIFYAELLNEELAVTKFVNLVEISADDLRITKYITLLELDYIPSSEKGIIVIGKTKTWRDHYPQNTTHIPPYQAYNFITSSNSMYMIDLEWDDVEDEDGYEIERSDDGLGDWELIAITDPDITKYISISLEPNTTYYYRIRSFNEGGYSPYSDVISETTKKIGPFILGKTTTVDDQNQNIVIEKPYGVQTGDYMLMQIGTQDIVDINYPSGWTLETVINGAYDNAILSKIALPDEPDSYTITRNSSTKPIVTVAIFAWDATDDNIIFYDG